MKEAADVEVLLTLQRMIIKALILADDAGLMETGIRLDHAREAVAHELRALNRHDLVAAPPTPPF